MQEFLQQLVGGLAIGGIFASLALALVLIYNAMGLVNFAQGEMAMLATFVAYALVSQGMSYWIAFPVTRSEEHTSELQSLTNLVCRLLLAPSHTVSSPLSLHDALPISAARRRTRDWRHLRQPRARARPHLQRDGACQLRPG